MSWMAMVDGATKVRGATEAARATVLEEGRVHRYETMGVVTVELPMGEVFEIHRQQTMHRVLQVAQCDRAGRLLLVVGVEASWGETGGRRKSASMDRLGYRNTASTCRRVSHVADTRLEHTLSLSVTLPILDSNMFLVLSLVVRLVARLLSNHDITTEFAARLKV
jgi:hypothetical protein